MSESTAIKIHRILTDPTASHWLKHSLETAIQRDPVDAANDADALAIILRRRHIEVESSRLVRLVTTKSIEELQELKKETYKNASDRGILSLIAKVARVLGEQVRHNYGPKYRYSTPDIEIYVDDYGNFMTVNVGDCKVCDTHPNSRLFVPGPWLVAIDTVYPLVCGKVTSKEIDRYREAFMELSRELGLVKHEG